MSKGYVYLAGPLFVDSEIRERREEAEQLRDIGFEVYSPIEQNDDIGFDIEQLYIRDINAMSASDLAVVRLDNYDSGTMAKLGWFVAKGIPVYSVWSNWKHEEPDNLFVRGMVVNHGNKLFKSFEELFESLKVDYNG